MNDQKQQQQQRRRLTHQIPFGLWDTESKKRNTNKDTTTAKTESKAQ